MSDRPYVRLYTFTVVAGLGTGDDPDRVAQRVHDTLVAAGFDISNAVFGQRTTRKQVDATLKAVGL